MRLIATVLLLATTISCHAQGTNEPDPAIVSVSGQGVVTAVPDMVTVSVGVATQAATAAAALTANNNAMSALDEVLDGFDIAERDRRTSNFAISPRYDRRANDGRAPTISSYEVNNQLSIRFREIDRLGELLDAVVTSGSNRIGGMNFGNTNEDELRDEARKAAVADARHRAELYAEAAGLELGKVVSISEAGAPQPRPMLRADMMMAEAAAVPISTGENEIRAVVQVIFTLE
jgi:uncharacterized protein YggE